MPRKLLAQPASPRGKASRDLNPADTCRARSPNNIPWSWTLQDIRCNMHRTPRCPHPCSSIVMSSSTHVSFAFMSHSAYRYCFLVFFMSCAALASSRYVNAQTLLLFHCKLSSFGLCIQACGVSQCSFTVLNPAVPAVRTQACLLRHAVSQQLRSTILFVTCSLPSNFFTCVGICRAQCERG